MANDITIYKNTGAFRFWARRYLGDGYRTDWNYEEILAAVMQKLSSEIAQTATLAAAVNNLTTVYNTMSGYNDHYPTADNYINQVNNELDIWAIDILPQFEEISTKYIISQSEV